MADSPENKGRERGEKIEDDSTAAFYIGLIAEYTDTPGGSSCCST